MLLERRDANPNNVDKWSQAPLSLAAKNGYEGIVRMLLKRNANPHKADNWSRTPLSLASRNGHQGVNSDTADTQYGQSQHQWGATFSREPTNLIPKYAPCPQSAEFFSPEPSKRHELPSKRACRF